MVNDQTAKADAGKPRLSLVPKEIMYAIARIREFGCRKYPEGGKDNWKQVEVRRYYDALLRHVWAAKDNLTEKDPESGMMALEHAACNLAFILELLHDRQGMTEDEYADWMDAKKRIRESGNNN